MSLSRWLQIYGLLWPVLGTFGLGFAAAITWSDVHPWNGMLVGGGLTLAIAAIATVLYVLVGFVEDALPARGGSAFATSSEEAHLQRGAVIEQ